MAAIHVLVEETKLQRNGTNNKEWKRDKGGKQVRYEDLTGIGERRDGNSTRFLCCSLHRGHTQNHDRSAVYRPLHSPLFSPCSSVINPFNSFFFPLSTFLFFSHNSLFA